MQFQLFDPVGFMLTVDKQDGLSYVFQMFFRQKQPMDFSLNIS